MPGRGSRFREHILIPAADDDRHPIGEPHVALREDAGAAERRVRQLRARARLDLRRAEASHGRQARVGVVGTVLERVGAVGQERSRANELRRFGAET